MYVFISKELDDNGCPMVVDVFGSIQSIVDQTLIIKNPVIKNKKITGFSKAKIATYRMLSNKLVKYGIVESETYFIKKAEVIKIKK